MILRLFKCSAVFDCLFQTGFKAFLGNLISKVFQEGFKGDSKTFKPLQASFKKVSRVY